MKFINKTDTIVLLYDSEVMHGQINPGCTSMEIDNDVVRKSPTIQGFLAKGIIARVGSDVNVTQSPQKFVKDTAVMAPKSTIDMVNQGGTLIPTEPYVPVAKDTKMVIPDTSSVDFVPNLQGSAEVIIANTKDVIGAETKRVSDIIKDGSEKMGKKLKASMEEVEARKKAKADREEKLANAPEDVKAFLALRHMAKKWAIAKSIDVPFLSILKGYEEPDSAAAKLIEQRLKELVASK